MGDPAVTIGPERAFRYIEFTTHFNNDALLPPYDYAKALHGMNAQRFKETSGAGDRHFIISDKFKGQIFGRDTNITFCLSRASRPTLLRLTMQSMPSNWVRTAAL